MLLIRASEEDARRRFKSEDRADWAQALPAVLEKHGLLEFEEAGP
jgi:hypothetical protein